MSEPQCECGHGASYHASGECWAELYYDGPFCRCAGWKRIEAAAHASSSAAQEDER